MTEVVATHVIEEAIRCGVQEFCLCPGKRNAPLVNLLKLTPHLKCYYFYDERSAAAFALGRSQATHRPTAIITTSGTATALLLAAAMEAYYTGIPLLLITADRPRHYRGTNAPQTCEQVNLYGQYTPVSLDLAHDEPCDLSSWDRRSPAHVNVCLEEPIPQQFPKSSTIRTRPASPHPEPTYVDTLHHTLDEFLSASQRPFVIVGGIKASAREPVAQFLLQLQAPVFLEGVSGLREDPRLQPLVVARTNGQWEAAHRADYPIDGILRIGGVPTFRLWRDLEEHLSHVPVYSLNDVPFSGLSRASVGHASLGPFFSRHVVRHPVPSARTAAWLAAEHSYANRLLSLLAAEPTSEPGLVHALSQQIPSSALVYLGNSLPIREWDLAATRTIPHPNVLATRGLSGIDGQISIFAGLGTPHQENWGIVGDLTALHDMSGPWIFSQLPQTHYNLVVINNGGGKIFERLAFEKEIQNCHSVRFEPLAKLWNLEYEEWRSVPKKSSCQINRLIEILPDETATYRYYQEAKNYEKTDSTLCPA